ncbi:FxsA family protein [Pasteuria penetrans]|uniref:FxsA family protein n=1 Tax=Pasteuria penetrans TaxID=86005 RepID=UPI000F9CE728|nr:FxsA family protein [Pasteuria penetrans]
MGRGSLGTVVMGWVLLEITFFFFLVSWLNFAKVVLLMIFMALLGVVVIAYYGIAAFRVVRSARIYLMRGEFPGGVVFEGFLKVVAGFLFVLPGFLNDVVGMLIFFPPVRSGCVLLGMRVLKAYVRRRL